MVTWGWFYFNFQVKLLKSAFFRFSIVSIFTQMTTVTAQPSSSCDEKPKCKSSNSSPLDDVDECGQNPTCPQWRMVADDSKPDFTDNPYLGKF